MQTKRKKLIKIATVGCALCLLLAYVIYAQLNGTIRMVSGTKSNACINNLRQIEGAKDQWAIENKKPAGTMVEVANITPFLKGNAPPACPHSGSYTVNAVGEGATCTCGSRLPE